MGLNCCSTLIKFIHISRGRRRRRHEGERKRGNSLIVISVLDAGYGMDTLRHACRFRYPYHTITLSEKHSEFNENTAVVIKPLILFATRRSSISMTPLKFDQCALSLCFSSSNLNYARPAYHSFSSLVAFERFSCSYMRRRATSFHLRYYHFLRIRLTSIS